MEEVTERLERMSAQNVRYSMDEDTNNGGEKEKKDEVLLPEISPKKEEK